VYTAHVYRPMYKAVYAPCTRRAKAVYGTQTRSCTRPVYGRCIRPCTWAVSTTVHTCTRPCTGRVDSRVRAVYTARVYTARVTVYTAVYATMCVHGRVHGPYTAVYTKTARKRPSTLNSN